MKFFVQLAFIFVPLLVSAVTEEKVFKNTLEKAQTFLLWLESHKDDFAKCSPMKKENTLVFCDGTDVKLTEIQKLFKLQPAKLVDFIKSEKIKLEIFCKDEKGLTFKDWCSTTQNRNFFKEVTSLHGQYIPAENTIALNSDSSRGSLIHEYLHYRQFKNENSIYGHIYKRERIDIQKEILQSS